MSGVRSNTRCAVWRAHLRQHLTVFVIAIVCGLGAYAIIRGFVYLNRTIGLG
jgi:hypothetical protein